MIMQHNKKGFTLVELVVVMAIIGIIAAILVPGIMNYVKKSRLQTANSNAKLAYNAVSAYVTAAQTEGTDMITALRDFSQAATNSGLNCSSPPAAAADKKIYDMLSGNGIESGYVWVLGSGAPSNDAGGNPTGNVTVNGKQSFAVQWAKGGAGDTVWGQYPNPILWEDYIQYIQGSSFRPGQYRDDWSVSSSS